MIQFLGQGDQFVRLVAGLLRGAAGDEVRGENVGVDYITGLMCAVIDKKLSSAVGFKGICKKVLILMLVGVANVVDIHIVGTGSALRSAVICFYLSNEGLSLLENAAHIGLPIPDKMKDVLAQLHGRTDEKKDETQEDEQK